MALKLHSYDKLTPGTVFFLPPCAIPLMLSVFWVVSLQWAERSGLEGTRCSMDVTARSLTQSHADTGGTGKWPHRCFSKQFLKDLLLQICTELAAGGHGSFVIPTWKCSFLEYPKDTHLKLYSFPDMLEVREGKDHSCVSIIVLPSIMAELCPCPQTLRGISK